MAYGYTTKPASPRKKSGGRCEGGGCGVDPKATPPMTHSRAAAFKHAVAKAAKRVRAYVLRPGA